MKIVRRFLDWLYLFSGVAAGGLLVFIVALGFFITPALLGGPKQMMISNLIEFNVRQVH